MLNHFFSLDERFICIHSKWPLNDNSVYVSFFIYQSNFHLGRTQNNLHSCEFAPCESASRFDRP